MPKEISSISPNFSEIEQKCGKFLWDLEKWVKKESLTMPKVVAVSKFRLADEIQFIYRHFGLKDFGENYSQELSLKWQMLKHLPLDFHYIGSIQSRKIKEVFQKSTLIHSLFEKDHLMKLETVNELKPYLIQLNLFDEQQKGGMLFSYDKLSDLLNSLPAKVVQSCVGLMAMGPSHGIDEDKLYDSFNSLRSLRDAINKSYPRITELSMGMSNDYKIAVKAGSTIIRVGTIIFGERTSTAQ